MKLDPLKVEDRGDIERERLVFRAREDVDVGRYAIFKCENSETKGRVLSANIPAVYWFPDKTIKAGDFVVVYSKAGARSEKKGDNGNMTYFYYWGFESAQWNKNYTPVLLEANTWSFVP